MNLHLEDEMPKRGDLRVWWIPQIPGKSFTVPVGNVSDPESLRRAKLLLNTLGDYDLFLLKTRNRPDYSNAGGLNVYDPKEGWIDWYDVEGRDIDTMTESDLEAEVVWEMDEVRSG